MALARPTKHDRNYYTLSKIYKRLLILTELKPFTMQSIADRSTFILISAIIYLYFVEI